MGYTPSITDIFGNVVLKCKFHPYNGKIADLQENDTNVHNEDISAVCGENVVAIIIYAIRMAGTGRFEVFPNGDNTTALYADTTVDLKSVTLGLEVGTYVFEWSNTVANDDWDVYLFGYFTQ